MSAPGKTIRLTIDLTYDPETMHGDDPESIEWFQGILSGDNLQLGEFFDVGDMIGTVKVVDCAPTQDERVRALVESLRPFSAAVFNDNGDVTISTGHLKRQDWLKLRAALRALEQGNP